MSLTTSIQEPDSISVVVPCRRSLVSLKRLLASLEGQTYPIDEVLVVHDGRLSSHLAASVHGTQLSIRGLTASGSIRNKINLGFQAAASNYVMLCHDNVALPRTYIESLLARAREGACAVSGLFLVPGESIDSSTQVPVTTVRDLVYRFLFQLPVCCDLNQLKTGSLSGLLARLLKQYYSRCSNQVSLAGWPQITCMSGDTFETGIWSTSAMLLHRDWCIPCDEMLDPDGTAECLELGLKLPGPITVTRETSFITYKQPTDRMTQGKAHGKRLLSLDYLMRQQHRFGTVNRLWLIWSLIGAYMRRRFKGEKEKASATITALQLMTSGQNPYVRGTPLAEIPWKMVDRRESSADRRVGMDRRAGNRRLSADRRLRGDRRQSADRRIVQGRRRDDRGQRGERRRLEDRRRIDRRSGRSDRRRPVMACFPELGFL